MNTKLKELAARAGLENTLGCFWQSSDDAIERFAELVRQDERQACFEFVYNYSDTYHHLGLCKRVAELMKDRGEE